MKMTFSEKQNNFVAEIVEILYKIGYNELATKLWDELFARNPEVLNHAKAAYEAIGGNSLTTKKIAAFGLREFVEEEMPVVYNPYEGRSKNDD